MKPKTEHRWFPLIMGLLVLGVTVLAMTVMKDSDEDGTAEWKVGAAALLFYAVSIQVVGLFKTNWIFYTILSVITFILLSVGVTLGAEEISQRSIADLGRFRLYYLLVVVFFFMLTFLSAIFRGILHWLEDN